MASRTETNRFEYDGPLRVVARGTNGADATFTVVPQVKGRPFLVVDVGHGNRVVVDDVTCVALAEWAFNLLVPGKGEV